MALKTLLTFAEKGGVGKTTISVNIAATLAEAGHRVLAVDGDKQANLSSFFLGRETVDDLAKINTIAAVLDTGVPTNARNLIFDTAFDNICVLPSNHYLAEHYVVHPEELKHAQWSLRELIESVTDQFAYVVIDSAPGINLLPGWACLLASDGVITPLEPEEFSTQSLTGTWQQLTAARNMRSDIAFLGYVINKLDGRNAMHKGYEKSIRKEFKTEVFKTVLRRLKHFAQSQHRTVRTPVVFYQPKSEEAQLVRALTKEILSSVSKAARTKTRKQKRKAA